MHLTSLFPFLRPEDSEGIAIAKDGFSSAQDFLETRGAFIALAFLLEGGLDAV